MDNAPIVKTDLPSNKNQNKQLQEDLREKELRETDLTRRKLFRTVSEALDAEDVVIDEEGTVISREPDHKTRLMAAREAREILGETAQPNKGMVMPNIVVKLPDGTVMAVGGSHGQ